MKKTDDRTAKYDAWAEDDRVQSTPVIKNLPHFGSRKFDSYDEFNAWKRKLIDQLAREGGAQWKKL
jgi:hypothetical protein